MRLLWIALPLIALTACDSPLGTEIARDQAKGVVNGIVEDKFPGIDATPVSDCVIDNASGSEIVQLASAAVTGVTGDTVGLVFEIAGRQETVTCFAESLGPIVIAGLIAANL